MKKRPFIIDCDTGTDDAIAIIAASHSDLIELRAITSVNGNVSEDKTSANNLNLVDYLGLDVPVAKGAMRPLLSGRIGMAQYAHGVSGLGTLVLPSSSGHFDKRMATELIYDEALKCGGELELLVIGPMTNIAVSLVLYPDLSKLIKHIWFMGGALKGGNVTESAEFNIWVDPEAAHIVFMSGIPMTMVGLDVTEKACMTKDDLDLISKTGTRASEVVAKLLTFMFERHGNKGELPLMHDPLALAAAIYPECLTFKDYFVDVEYKGEYTSGHTAADLRGKSGHDPNVSVATELDVTMFRKWLVDMVIRK